MLDTLLRLFLRYRPLLASFGPGLLYAGAAVGVSHLVQSTRAGADFGYQLLWVVIVINIIKYPIFEIGPRYAAATGETLLDGYRKLGAWAVWVYMIISVSTMFIVMGAISMVTAGLFANLLDLDIAIPFLAVMLLAVSALILVVGKYHTLDRLMKMVVVLLTICTITAVLFGILNPSARFSQFETSFDFLNEGHLLFLVALVGWMPAPIDLSIWHSVWSVSKNRSRSSRVDMKNALIDFRIGYWGTTLIAVCFLALGALMMFGTGEEPSSDGVTFAGQVIHMYVINLGFWAYPFIALAAFTTMFSTLITCLDAFPRTLRKSSKLLFKSIDQRKQHGSLYHFWILVTCMGTAMVLLNLASNMRQMVDLATTISFAVAPLLAVLNYVVMMRYVDPALQQSLNLRRLNLFAILLLSLFTVAFILYRF